MKVNEEVISRQELSRLPEYSCTTPTGVTIGKRWRRDTHAYRDQLEPEWMIGEYVDIGRDDVVDIKWVWALDEDGNPHRGDLGGVPDVGC